mmetsp:Transcript_22982/g.36613  ORF Transcript_22982/g.36613 Transcript_22982/m.36613 type:complete len:223 (-) Transcript_22982:309-977(-)
MFPLRYPPALAQNNKLLIFYGLITRPHFANCARPATSISNVSDLALELTHDLRKETSAWRSKSLQQVRTKVSRLLYACASSPCFFNRMLFWCSSKFSSSKRACFNSSSAADAAFWLSGTAFAPHCSKRATCLSSWSRFSCSTDVFFISILLLAPPKRADSFSWRVDFKATTFASSWVDSFPNNTLLFSSCSSSFSSRFSCVFSCSTAAYKSLSSSFSSFPCT